MQIFCHIQLTCRQVRFHFLKSLFQALRRFDVICWHDLLQVVLMQPVFSTDLIKYILRLAYMI